MYDSQTTFNPSQVFTFCGHIVDEDALNLKSGYVIAADPEAAITSMRGYGFSITAISSLNEVKETIGILQLIAARTPEVDASEYIDLVKDAESLPVRDERVFTFVGHYGAEIGDLKVGFALATSASLLCDYLEGYQFVIHSVTSLADLRASERELELIAAGSPSIDDCNYLNLMLSS